jgi:serine/threonine-protein kinase
VLARLLNLGADAADSHEDRLRKRVTVAGAVGVPLLATMWVAVYATLGLWRAAAIPAGYQLLAIATLIWFARSRRVAAFRMALLTMWLVLPVALQWSLGGFVASAAVMAWAVVSPLAAVLLHGTRASIPWFIAFVALTVASAIAEPWLAPQTPPLSESMLLFFTATNIGGVCAVSYGLLVYAFHQRETAQAALDREHERAAHLRERELERVNEEVRRQVAERSRELSDALGKLSVGGSSLEAERTIDGRYRVGRRLGVGGMGAVYEVERLTDRKRLALKTLRGRGSPDALARFAREAQIAAQLHHPNLVPVLDVGIADGLLFLVMPLIAGGSLEQMRPRFGDAAWGISLLAPVAAGLTVLHDRGILHRDLKPGNILLADGVPQIADFGLASLRAESRDTLASVAHADTAAPLTHAGDVMGTPAYMAPELAAGAGAASPASDVFAFGVIAYELLSGRLPFARPLVLAHTESRAPDLAVAPVIAGPISRCLALNPSARPSATELETALRALPGA